MATIRCMCIHIIVGFTCTHNKLEPKYSEVLVIRSGPKQNAIEYYSDLLDLNSRLKAGIRFFVRLYLTCKQMLDSPARMGNSEVRS